jgi:uncharacterized protein YdeI (YjbR/CyaY-like superfamily)
MNNDRPELIFPRRSDFRAWLSENAESSGSVWLVFGKTKDLPTLTANEALEEALCFGWIDGLIKSVDQTRYIKYFARRQPRSVWSDKNKKTAEMLREKGLMTALGETAIQNAVQSGSWGADKPNPVTDEQVAELREMLADTAPAYQNFMNMSPSVQRTYARAYYAPKSEDARQRSLNRIVDRLNKNLKPM